MQVNNFPLNLDLLIPKDHEFDSVKPIKVLDIFTSNSRNFHPDGLFSTEIFGKIGDERRNRLYGYIDLKVPIFHPIIYDCICDLKSLYKEILSGTSYAIFDKDKQDFIKVDITQGETGYSFFVKYFPKLVFEEKLSASRQFNIEVVNKYKNNPFIDKFLVMPAGLRDYEIDDNGKPTEDEINTLYRKVMSVVSVIDNINTELNTEYLDSARHNLQININAIYAYIKNMLEGKSKFIQGKWASRKIFNSTRNVITSYLHDSPELFGDTSVSTNNTVVGLYQFLRMIMPLAVNRIRDTYLSNIFVGPNSPAILVNKTTLKKQSVNIDPNIYDEWMTFEGIEKLCAKFGQENLRHDILEIDDYYFGLIYKGPDNTYRFLQDISELPEDRDTKDVSPITFVELLYLSVYKDAPRTPCLVTRYPITGYGSIYPSYVYLKTTNKSEIRYRLDESWNITEDKAVEYPKYGDSFYDAFAPSTTHIARLGADFDGDALSCTALLTEESKLEVKRKLQSREYYIGVNQKFAFSANTDILDLVLSSMTSN